MRTITANGKTLTVKEWADVLGTQVQIVNSRLARGWDEQRAVTEQIWAQGQKTIITKNDAELELNEMALAELPEQLKSLLGKYRGVAYGKHLRVFYRAHFDKWFEEVYKPTHESNTKQGLPA